MKLLLGVVVWLIGLNVTLGAIVNPEPIPTDTNNELFLRAVGEGKTKVIRRLLRAGVNINYQDETGTGAIHLAQTLEVLQLLQSCPDLDIGSVDKDGNTALMLAAKRGNLDCMLALIGMQAKVNLQNDTGKTALMIATLHKRIDAICILLQKGANVDVKDQLGKTALHYAARTGQLLLVKYLTDARASVNERCSENLTPLEEALDNPESSFIVGSYLLGCEATITNLASLPKIFGKLVYTMQNSQVGKYGQLIGELCEPSSHISLKLHEIFLNRKFRTLLLQPAIFEKLSLHNQKVVRSWFKFDRHLRKIASVEMFQKTIEAMFAYFSDTLEPIRFAKSLGEAEFIAYLFEVMCAYMQPSPLPEYVDKNIAIVCSIIVGESSRDAIRPYATFRPRPLN